MESARRFRHDLRHHLTVLGTLNAQGRREEITAYLREYGAVADRLDSMSFSGDPVVDGVLSFYLARAARSMILLRIRNTCAEEDGTGGPVGWEAFSGGDGLRGVGLGSVASIAEKYNGSALFERKNGVFTTRIILNPKQSQNSREAPSK